CYLNTVTLIDQLTSFIEANLEKKGDRVLGGRKHEPLADRRNVALEILPVLRGRLSENRRVIGSFSDHPDVMEFVNSVDAAKLAYLGTSCPDHFIRTKIRPMFVPWDPKSGTGELRKEIEKQVAIYRREYGEYYKKHAEPSSPAMRDAIPAVVLIPGLGMFTFGKSKPESRIIGEFYLNAIHVIKGAGGLESAAVIKTPPQCGSENLAQAFQVYSNYVAMPASEAFRIEYWMLEEAKIRRQPPEKELSRQIVVVVGGGSGIGREVALLAAERGAHVVVADRDTAGAERVAEELKKTAGKEAVIAAAVDIRKRESIGDAIRRTVEQFGGADIVINTAALFPSSPSGVISDEQWALTLEVNVTA